MNEEQLGGQSPRQPGGSDAPAWLERAQQQWKLYVGIAAVLTAIIAGSWWFVADSQEKNEKAAAQLSRIRATFEAGEFEAALTADTIPPVGTEPVIGLLEISDTYSGTDAGKVAALMAGNSLANLGRFDEARTHFERATGSNAIVVEVGGMQGLASCEEAAGNNDGAAELYEQAAKRALNTGLEGQCYYRAGLNYEKSGNTEKAGELYTLVAKKYEVSEVAPLARTGLARLGMAID
jgi:tetratricopeptide (TPR) repeat protein